MSASSRRTALAIAALAACLAISLSSPSHANPARTECHAVANVAGVVADELLAVTLVEEKDKKVCIFFVAPPPHTSTDPTSVADSFANMVDGEPLNFVTAVLKNAGFAELLADSMVQALKDESVTTDMADAAAALSEAIKGESDTLLQCSLEAFSNGAKFAPVEEGASCGLDTSSGRRFVAEASKGGLSVQVFLPLKAS